MRARIILADDHTLLLDAFRHLLEPKYEVVGTATDGREMLKMVSKLAPDLVLMDIAMPNLNGIDAGEKLKKNQPHVKLVFLTVNEEPDMIAEAFRIGADGYLLKSTPATELFEAIETVLNSKSYLSRKLANTRTGASVRNPGAQTLHGDLSLRQREVLQLLAEGHTMKKVAVILNITPRTVAFHKYQIMENLDVETNSELIQYAIKHGFVT